MYYYSQYYLLSQHFPSFPSLQLHTDFYLDSFTYWNTSKVIFPISAARFFRISVSSEVPPTSELLKFETINFLQCTPSLFIFCCSQAHPSLIIAPPWLSPFSPLTWTMSEVSSLACDSLATHPAQVTRWPFWNFNSVNITPLAKTCTGFFLIAHRINLALGALES